jgi:hypothetical protein
MEVRKILTMGGLLLSGLIILAASGMVVWFFLLRGPPKSPVTLQLEQRAHLTSAMVVIELINDSSEARRQVSDWVANKLTVNEAVVRVGIDMKIIEDPIDWYENGLIAKSRVDDSGRIRYALVNVEGEPYEMGLLGGTVSLMESTPANRDKETPRRTRVDERE